MKRICIIIASMLIVLSIGFISCKKDNMDNLTNSKGITKSISKIETLYKEGSQKIETKANTKESDDPGPPADTSVLNANDDEINRLIQENPESKNRGKVGVLNYDGCGGYVNFLIRIDSEDHNNLSSYTGNIGQSYLDAQGNVVLNFCLVDNYFEKLKDYPFAVLQVDPYLYYGQEVFSRYIDAEDDNNISVFNYNGTVYWPSTSGVNSLVPPTFLTSVGNIQMQFIYYSGDPQFGVSDLPTLSMNYGVFGSVKNKTHGTIFSDDEDDQNANQFHYVSGLNGSVNPIPTTTVHLNASNTYTFPGSSYPSYPIMKIDRNTKFYLCKAH